MVNQSATKEARVYNGEKTVSSINGARKLRQLHENSEIRTFSNTMHKNNVKMDQRLKGKTTHNKTVSRKHRQNTL